MKRYVFPYGTDEIQIESEGEIYVDILDGINKIIKDLNYELNHKIQNSSAYSFNETKTGVEARVSREFIIFLEINVLYTKKNFRAFNPFITEEIVDENFGQSIVVDEKTNRAAKLSDIMIDSSKIQTEYILDTVKEYLLYQGEKEFLIKYKDKYIHQGRKPKQIIFNIENKKLYKTYIKNQAIAMNFNYNSNNPVQTSEGFASSYKLLVNKFSITKNISLVENKVMASYLEVVNTKKEYTFFAKLWQTDISIVDMKDEVHHFSQKN